jgi:prepilin-type processing-associated H-X9-DG protein
VESNYPRFPELGARSNRKLTVFEVLLIGVILVILVAVFFPVSTGSGPIRKMVALSNIKQIGLGLIMYSDDFDDQLSVANKWMDLTLHYAKKEALYHALEVPSATPSTYGTAFRSELSGRDTTKIAAPEHRAMAFDSTLMEWNAASGLWSLPNPPRHSGRSNVVVFADGHAKAVTQEASQNLK